MRPFALAIAAFVAAVLFYTVQQEKQWHDYAAAHHCRVRRVQRDQVTQGIETIYTCDAGEIQIH